ncbi:MAG: hypothetical protein JWN76_3274 [Chitinophagaceae bacterium]|nr:hypothetical protein [Chitinophagaceae bacterium]
MKTFLLSVVCFIGFATSTPAQTKKELKVQAAVESLRKAMIDADVAQLDKLVSEDLSYGHSGGNIQTKAQFIDAIKSGSSDFVTIDLTNQTVKVTGNTAVVRHALSATTNDNGKPGTVKLSVMLVWIKTHGGWKLLARQAVKVV